MKMKMKHTANISIIKKAVAFLLSALALISLVSCDSKTEDAASVLADDFKDIWDMDTRTFTKIEYFEYGSEQCYNFEYDLINGDDNSQKKVNAIIVSYDGKTCERYIHSVDFERDNINKKYYQAYLDAVEAGTVVVFTAEEIAEVQAKVEELVK